MQFDAGQDEYDPGDQINIEPRNENKNKIAEDQKIEGPLEAGDGPQIPVQKRDSGDIFKLYLHLRQENEKAEPAVDLLIGLDGTDDSLRRADIFIVCRQRHNARII